MTVLRALFVLNDFRRQLPIFFVFHQKTLATLYPHHSIIHVWNVNYIANNLLFNILIFDFFIVFSFFFSAYRHIPQTCKWRWLTRTHMRRKCMSFLIKPSINHHRNTHTHIPNIYMRNRFFSRIIIFSGKHLSDRTVSWTKWGGCIVSWCEKYWKYWKLLIFLEILIHDA